MKLLKKDLKHNVLTVVPENADDLWIISEILQKGDMVSGRTQRSIKTERSDTRTAVRRNIFAKVSVEKVDFEGGQLRAAGKILECSEGERGWHAFEIMPGQPVSIEREWKKYEIQRLEDAKVKHPKILVCVMDDSEADFYMVTEKLQHLASFRGVTGKAYGQEGREKYYAEILNYMKEKDCFRIILAGPGFAKEELVKMIKDGRELAGKVVVDGIAHAGEAGMKEVLRRGTIEKIVKSSSIALQTRLVEEFFAGLSRDGKVVYGRDDVRKASEAGAVAMLLVSDRMVRENEGILKSAENTGAEVRIIYSNHEAGERLLALGGFGAFLRYKIEL
ncbi:MAG: mRNA surveillance protein pelota [Candidatus Aenigmarchaeota archaeon]|nr:mRNA surveillance protein pelota [Candidatus Aenigmarchaeota archaeon]